MLRHVSHDREQHSTNRHATVCVCAWRPESDFDQLIMLNNELQYEMNQANSGDE